MFVSAFIEKNTWAGLEEFFLNLAQSLHIECEEKLHKQRLSLLTPGMKNERINENNSDKNALEADIDGEENSDKDISECSVSQLQKESKNTSMASGSSKGMWITMFIRILETLIDKYLCNEKRLLNEIKFRIIYCHVEPYLISIIT